MESGRREFLKYLTAAAFIGGPSVPLGEGATNMFGLIAKLTSTPGKRDVLMTILIEGTRDMSGCFSYVVAKDSVDENTIWVTEIWDSQTSHDASLTLPAVKNAMAQGRPLIAAFEKIATTNPVGGFGLPPKSA
jgi:quinol monooxygenase YgiN